MSDRFSQKVELVIQIDLENVKTFSFQTSVCTINRYKFERKKRPVHKLYVYSSFKNIYFYLIKSYLEG